MIEQTDLTTTDAYPTRRGHAGILPRRDPVLHAPAASQDGPLSAEQLAEYERNGFLLLPKLLSASEVLTLTGALTELRAEARGSSEDGIIRERGSDEVRSIFAVHDRDDALGAIARHPTLVGAAQQILADTVYIHQSRVNFKPGLVGGAFSWHSDFETWHAEDGMPRMRAVSVSVLLDDNHAWNGPLMLMPGSHRAFVACAAPTPLSHHRESLVHQEVGTPSSEALRVLFEAAGERIELALGAAGTVVLFDCNTLHASPSNLSPHSRTNVFLVYNAVSNRLRQPFGAARPRPAFLATREPRALLAA